MILVSGFIHIVNDQAKVATKYIHTNVLPTLIRRILDLNNVFKAPNPLFFPLERLCLRVVDHHTGH